MKFLVIEDDTNKIKQISEFIAENFKNDTASFRNSYQSGLKAIFEEEYDLVLLDMQLPTFDIKSGEDGYKFRKLAGLDIMQELKRKKNNSSIIVVTQFETFGEGESYVELTDLKKILSKEFPENYVATVYYNPSQSAWKNELMSLIKKADK